jgi:hypothetical protein
MPVFISHSERDQAPYTGLCLALDAAGVPRWDPKSMSSGTSLREQLRDAILLCEVCIFVLTRSSVKSQWCIAEAGAFWGAAKRIILFKASPDIDEKAFPAFFKGDLWTCDMGKVVDEAKRATAAAALKANGSGLPPSRAAHEAAMLLVLTPDETTHRMQNILAKCLRDDRAGRTTFENTVTLIEERIVQTLNDTTLDEFLRGPVAGRMQRILDVFTLSCASQPERPHLEVLRSVIEEWTPRESRQDAAVINKTGQQVQTG